jgi:ubiquinone/menaquinone biosynthesis C-methylase UbiE
MKPKLQRRIQRYGWDKAADVYEGSWQAQLRPAHDVLLRLAHPLPTESVIDIAAGTGLVTFRIAEQTGPGGRVFGTDISEEMVNRASRIATQRGLRQVSFARMGAEELDCDDNSFDLAICAFGLMYVPEPETAMAEIHRVLKPQGRVAISVWGERNKCGWSEIFPIVDARVTSDVCPMFYQLGTGRNLEILLERSGFSDILVEKIEPTIDYASTREALDAAFAGGPVALPYEKFSLDTREAAHAEYLASIEPYRHGDGYRVPSQFVIALGRKSA